MSTIMIKIEYMTISPHQLNETKQLHPKGHVGSFPMPNDPTPMLLIFVYPVEIEDPIKT